MECRNTSYTLLSPFCIYTTKKHNERKVMQYDKIEKVNWYEEELDKFYKHDNNGLVWGIYYYDDTGSDIIEVEWYKTEKERDETKENKELITIMDKLVFRCNVCRNYLDADSFSPRGEMYMEACRVCQEVDWKEMDTLRDKIEELEKMRENARKDGRNG